VNNLIFIQMRAENEPSGKYDEEHDFKELEELLEE
jgi:hypothetical protein